MRKIIAMNCPTCQSENIIKNGSIHNVKQKYACKDCNRQFIITDLKTVFLKKRKT